MLIVLLPNGELHYDFFALIVMCHKVPSHYDRCCNGCMADGALLALWLYHHQLCIASHARRWLESANIARPLNVSN